MTDKLWEDMTADERIEFLHNQVRKLRTELNAANEKIRDLELRK